MNPTSAQHAALRLLIEDVDPLLQRAEEIAQTLSKVREELHADLTTLGQLVQQTLDAQPLMLEAGRKLSASAARIEAGLQATATGTSQHGSTAALHGPLQWRACAISAVLRPVSSRARSGSPPKTCWSRRALDAP